MSGVLRARGTRRRSGRWLPAVAGAALLLGLAGCSAGEEDAAPADVATDDEVAADGDEPAAEAGGDDGTEEVAAEGGAADGSADAEVAEAPPRLDLGLPAIALDAPASGAGRRPQLSWETVGAAARYRVTLFAEDGRAYWAWRGTDTSVTVGGGADASVSGPRVQPGMTWAVTAFDADGAPVAQSGERPIAP